MRLTSYRGLALRLTPRLVLFGFSRDDTCALDSAVGGGVAYSIPLRADASIVLGGGAILLPQYGPNASAAATAQLRADVVVARPGQRPVTAGLRIAPHSTLFAVGGLL